MKMNQIRHSLKEGFSNILRHPLVTLASVSTIGLMLVLLGSFTAFSVNARHITAAAGQQPPIEITMENGVASSDLTAVDSYLSSNETVVEYHMYTPQENFDQFKVSMEDPELFEGFPVENIPYTFSVRLSDPALGSEFKAQVEGYPGVRSVSLEQAVMTFLSNAIVWVNYATLVAFAVLGVVAFFIISNMVRVAVFARGDEISIMKYVGATNWYIRIPYIIEGSLVGLSGALLSWVVIMVGYNQIYSALMSGTKPTDFLTMVSASQLSWLVLVINLLIGAVVGALGSAVSVRRHIRV